MPKSRSLKEIQSAGLLDVAGSAAAVAEIMREVMDSVIPPPPREPGSERSYTFKGPTGTRYSDKPEPREGEKRID